MKSWMAAVLLTLVVGVGAFGAGKGPEIDLVDNKLSVNADTILTSLEAGRPMQHPLMAHI